MEQLVLSDRRLASIAEWQDAIDATGFALRLSSETPFDELDGFLPAQLGERSTGFECRHWPADGLIVESPDLDFGRRRWRHALSFRCGGMDIWETPAALMAGATDGIVLDCEEGRLLTPQQAAENARDMERDMPRLEAALRGELERLRLEPAEQREEMEFTITARLLNPSGTGEETS
jgi:hypothetical protein